MVYFVKSEARTGTYYKIGFAKDISKRMNYYGTHNPNAKLLEFCITYEKTKHQLETAIHEEVKALGYEFVEQFGVEREWFFVPMDKEVEFEAKGLKQFKACKNRQVYKVQ